MSEQVMLTSQCVDVMPLLLDTVVVDIGTIELKWTGIVSANSCECPIFSETIAGGRIGKTICLYVVW
jgi:hypothetical protein